MSMVAHRTFTGDFRKFFLRGLAVLLPSVLTIWIIVQAYQFVDRRVADPINRWVRMGLIEVIPGFWPEDGLPEWYVVSDKALADEAERRASNNLPTLDEATLRKELQGEAFKGWWDKHAWLNVIGLIFAVVLFYLAGRIFGGFLGRRLADSPAGSTTKIQLPPVAWKNPPRGISTASVGSLNVSRRWRVCPRRMSSGVASGNSISTWNCPSRTSG